MSETIRTTVETYRNRRNGYGFTHLMIRTMYLENTQASLGGTVDNKAGYGSLDAAQRMGRMFQGLLDDGYSEHYTSSLGCGLNIHIEWQHYDGGGHPFCDPNFENLGRGFTNIEKAMSFLKKLGMKIERARARHSGYRNGVTNMTFNDPQEVLTALIGTKGTVLVERRDHVWVPLLHKKAA